MFLDQVHARIKSKRSIVIDHQQPELAGAEKRLPTLFPQALQNLDNAFRTTFELVASGARDPESLIGLVPDVRLLTNEDWWRPHLRSAPGQIRAPLGKPVVGFHSYGNRYRYPSNATDFRNIYVSDAYSTKIFGQQDLLRKKFGEEVLESLDLVPTSEMTEKDFLEGIDFWVYYPNERLIDCLWEPVLEAMQAGKVVILPTRLQRIYGSAAVYSDKDRVFATIAELSEQNGAYELQAQKGQAFVAQHYSSAAFLRRIDGLIQN